MADAYLPNQPGGPFMIDADGDGWKSHLDRINPCDGISPAAVPGARPSYWAAEAALRGSVAAVPTVEEVAPVPAKPDQIAAEVPAPSFDTDLGIV